ncbi:FecR family protein [Sulfurimonas sp.]
MKTIKILMLLLILACGNLFANKTVANITALKGKADISRDSAIFVATLGAELQQKDTIKTKDNTKLQVIFEDETIISIGKNSEFSIEEYLFEDNREPIAKFAMLKGAMRTITGHIGDIAPQKFNVETKTATIGIRGTNFSVFVQNDGSTQAFCTFGAIGVSVAGVSNVVNQGFMLNVSPEGAVEVKEFTPADLKQKREESFGDTTEESDTKTTTQETTSPIETTEVENNTQIDTTRPKIPVLIETELAEEKDDEKEDVQETVSVSDDKDIADKIAAEEAAAKALADAAAAAAETTTTTTTTPTTTVDPDTVLTDSTVIAGYTQNNVMYSGTFAGTTEGAFDTAGSAALELDFGHDTAKLTLSGNNEVEAIYNSNPANLDSNAFSNLVHNNGGVADGKFYGTTGAIVNGNYTYKEDNTQTASGTYNVTTTNIDGSADPQIANDAAH